MFASYPELSSIFSIMTGIFILVRRAFSSKLRGVGFKCWPDTVGGSVTVIMWGTQPG